MVEEQRPRHAWAGREPPGPSRPRPPGPSEEGRRWDRLSRRSRRWRENVGRLLLRVRELGGR
eukprot:1632309-Lingulodinium_polyedra.AAC.1